MRRHLIATLCTAGLILGSGAATAQDDAGASNPAKAAGPAKSGAIHTKRHLHVAKPRNALPDAGKTGKAATAMGAIRTGEQAVKTDKTLNDNTMKILPP